jgi:cytochrome oxidase Cu insertion factor (SCO1/SenC/PrrC family)
MRTVFTTLLAIALTATAVAQAKPATAAPPEPKIKVGSIAPNFTLRDQDGKEVKLSDFRGKKNVVLAFYVFAFTGG